MCLCVSLNPLIHHNSTECDEWFLTLLVELQKQSELNNADWLARILWHFPLISFYFWSLSQCGFQRVCVCVFVVFCSCLCLVWIGTSLLLASIDLENRMSQNQWEIFLKIQNTHTHARNFLHEHKRHNFSRYFSSQTNIDRLFCRLILGPMSFTIHWHNNHRFNSR